MVYYGVALAADDLGGKMYREYILSSLVDFPAVILAIYLCNNLVKSIFLISNTFYVLLPTTFDETIILMIRIFNSETFYVLITAFHMVIIKASKSPLLCSSGKLSGWCFFSI